MEVSSAYHPDLVDRIAGRQCRRFSLFDDDCADFRQHVHLKLIENDYDRLRKYKGESGLNTYLHAVIGNLARDYLDHLRGKWRPSAKAKRLGPAAVDLERLITRDGNSAEEAVQVALSRSGNDVPEKELRRLVNLLPLRSRRRAVTAGGLELVESAEHADDEVGSEEDDRRRSEAGEKLGAALAKLDHEDRLMIKMRYFDGFSVVRIAQTLNLEQKPLYDRIKRVLRQLKSYLEAEQLSIDEVKDLFDA